MVRKEYEDELKKWNAEHPIEINLKNIKPNADGCPKCSSEVIRYRKTLGNWICRAVNNGVMCKHVFDTPKKVISYATLRELEKEAKLTRQPD
jgi:ribosomal protein L37AE/L43A